MRYYVTIGAIQKCISNAETLDEALQASLKIMIEHCGAEQAVLWYDNKNGDGRLHPGRSSLKRCAGICHEQNRIAADCKIFTDRYQ